jgi:hypothetical protein
MLEVLSIAAGDITAAPSMLWEVLLFPLGY